MSKSESNHGIQTRYLAIGRYTGSLYHLMPSWKCYFFEGTLEEVKILFSKLFMENYNSLDNSENLTFRQYCDLEKEESEDKMIDTEILDYLNEMTLDNMSDDYNMGYKLLKEMTESDWANQKNGTWINYDKTINFDTVY